MRASTSLPVPVSPVINTGTLVGAIRRARLEDVLHLFGEEDGAALTFDGVGGPQRGPIPLFLSRVFQRQGSPAEAKDVAQEDGLLWLIWYPGP